MKNTLKTINWLMLISGSLIAVLGITMLFTPLATLVTLAAIIGIAMIISGISEIVSFYGEAKGHRSGWMLASGIITGLLGIWTLFGRGSQALAAIIPFVFAVWVMTSSIMRIVGSINLKAEGFSGWAAIFVLGVIGTILGFILLFSPVLSSVIVAYSIAFMLITYGINNVILFFRLHKLGKAIQEQLGS